jgi:S-DNA-T family DNA segregation ATPase FtsK/SpoIIIE
MGRRKKLKNIKIPIEILGILLIVIGIIGFLGYKANIVGKYVKGAGMLLMGSLYFVFLALLIIIGGYMLIKRKRPKYLTLKTIGAALFFIGVLSLAHLALSNMNLDKSLGIKENMEIGFNTFVNCLENKEVFTGGGLIGLFFVLVLDKFLGYIGSIIVIAVIMFIGLVLFSNFSLLDIISSLSDKVKIKKSNNDDEYEEDEDDDEEEVKGHGLKDNRVAISSIDELTNPKQEEEYKQSMKENMANSFNNTNLYKDYKLPDIDLLAKPSKTKNTKEQEEEIKRNIKLLENVLKDFEVYAKVVEVHVGPAVTQYELELKSGTKMNKITSLHSEIALALAAKDVRIEAPIPGKSTVGVEIPNKVNSMVSFREIIASFPKDKFNNKLMVALGKDIMGNAKYFEINKTPHLLIAGATGSGKSVCINCLIGSILMRAKPDEVKLVMIDPKKVELGIYNGIPHLITPVVVDPKKASLALQRVVKEMERRYDLFSDSKTKNIETYNDYVKKQNDKLPEESRLPILPYWVVIIDELADLMLVCSKEVEDSIMRITQMARAAGIHLVVATQRPSTNVITGVIKANIPSRISFAVSSFVDSRTILDMAGAEKLLGKGDMLFLPMGESIPQRIQGAYVSEDEINKLVDFCSSQQKAVYDEDFTKESGNTTTDGFTSDKNDVEQDDPIYNEALEFVLSTGKASASLLQRKFKLGYNRAARLIDLFEERGIIGPQQGSKPREVLYKVEQDNE